MNRKDGGRQQVVVDANRRHRDAVDRGRQGRRNRHARRGRATSWRPRRPTRRTTSAREIRELERVVLEDAILLPLLEAGVLKIRRERLENFQCRQRYSVGFSSAARVATLRLPVTTDSRVPCCSVTSDQKP